MKDRQREPGQRGACESRGCEEACRSEDKEEDDETEDAEEGYEEEALEEGQHPSESNRLERNLMCAGGRAQLAKSGLP